jgi:hypothetical protein
MDLIHGMHYKHTACAIWDEPIKKLVPNKRNKILPTYLTYVSSHILP